MIGSVCSDGAPAMLGNRSGFAAMLKEEISELKITHCLLHRQALAFKTLPTCLKDTLNSCVKIVNYQRSCFESPFVSIALPRCQSKRQTCFSLPH